MRHKDVAEKNTSPRVGRIPWRVESVRVVAPTVIYVTFVDGTSGEVDMAALIHSKDAGVFAALRDPKVFEQVYVELGAVTWPGEVDLAPDAMYDEIKAHGRFVIPG